LLSKRVVLAREKDRVPLIIGKNLVSIFLKSVVVVNEMSNFRLVQVSDVVIFQEIDNFLDFNSVRVVSVDSGEDISWDEVVASAKSRSCSFKVFLSLGEGNQEVFSFVLKYGWFSHKSDNGHANAEVHGDGRAAACDCSATALAPMPPPCKPNSKRVGELRIGALH